MGRGHRDVQTLVSCEEEWEGSQGMGMGHRSFPLPIDCHCIIMVRIYNSFL